MHPLQLHINLKHFKHMKKIVNKTVNLDLIGKDGNAFMIMGLFGSQAKKEGWTKDEIDAVIKEAKSKDYNHLLVTIENHCEPKDESHDN